MKKIIFLIAVLFLSNCSNKNDDLQGNLNDEVFINKNLENVLIQFSAKCDTLVELDYFSKVDIIVISFLERDGEKYLSMRTGICFNKRLIKGSILFDERLVLFYGDKDIIYKDFIKEGKINRALPLGYDDCMSPKIMQMSYDPIGITYKILSNNKLEFVSNKYLADVELNFKYPPQI